jgi:hypothetical protein
MKQFFFYILEKDLTIELQIYIPKGQPDIDLRRNVFISFPNVIQFSQVYIPTSHYKS